MTWETDNEEANGLTRRGISLAAAGDFQLALSDFEAAILLREKLPWQAEPLIAWGLSAGWINRGDALAGLDFFAAAALSYEQGARVLKGLGFSPERCQREGILWNNHGLALEKNHENDAAALSFRRAIDSFLSVENGKKRFGLGLAAAHLHLSRVSAGAEALREAGKALDLVRNEESFLAVELNLKASHQICARLCENLLEKKTTGGDWIAEVTDLAEEGLSLWRDFERSEENRFREKERLREVALDLFRLGLRVYRVCQPQFFCEFLREFLDFEISTDVPFYDERFWAVAVSALQEAMADQLDYEVINTEEIELRKTRLQELRALDERLAQR